MLEKEMRELNKLTLGKTMNCRMESMIEICKNKCGIYINKSNNKHRQKLLRYIKEYEKYGDTEFILIHKKKHFTPHPLTN